jgi:hypothetical protein
VGEGKHYRTKEFGVEEADDPRRHRRSRRDGLEVRRRLQWVRHHRPTKEVTVNHRLLIAGTAVVALVVVAVLLVMTLGGGSGGGLGY